MTSTALDRAAAIAFNESKKAGCGNALFIIEGGASFRAFSHACFSGLTPQTNCCTAVREGLHLQGISQYPSETEFLLPMFSMLEVVEVSQREPLELRCKYKSCLMPGAFQSKCLADLEEAQR